MSDKSDRKSTIISVINSRKVHTQEELANILAGKGFDVTQATLSRDIKQIGAVKVADFDGSQYYKIPLRHVAKSSMEINRIEVSGQLCVLHCQPGFASAVASLIDDAQLEGVMGTIAGDDTICLMMRCDCDTESVAASIRSMFNISEVDVRIATVEDCRFAEDICEEIYISSQERKTGIARRSPEYIKEKMLAGKAVIAVSENGEFAGFSYIESWGGKSFVATSGLIVAHKFRGLGIAKRIKEQTFHLARKLFPDAKIFSITTGAAVMRMNYEFGFRPVPFSELTDDPEFWKGCEGCRHFDILKSHDYNMCICTGLLYDPKDHLQIHNTDQKKN